jgi:hypothetical protein
LYGENKEKMKILIIADEPKKSELMARLGKGHKIHAYEETEYYDIDGFEGYNAIFDLNLEMHSDAIEEYSQLQETIIVTSGVKTSLAELVYLELIEDELTLIGLNDLTGFINREKAEVSLLDDSDAIKAIAFFKELKCKRPCWYGNAPHCTHDNKRGLLYPTGRNRNRS